MGGEVRVLPVAHIPDVCPGDDVAALIWAALVQQDLPLRDGDVVVVTQKIVSKAEGCLVDLQTVEPSAVARNIALSAGKDPREVEVVLRETHRIVRMSGGTLICETRHGLVCANAGVDHSNTEAGVVCLLPADPDASAQRIRSRLQGWAGARLAVIVSDTFGRPWRLGQTNVAIGVAGMLPIADYRGQYDTAGRELRVTALAVADELAAAAELVMNKVDRVPVAVIRGYQVPPGAGGARDMVRPAEKDLFR